MYRSEVSHVRIDDSRSIKDRLNENLSISIRTMVNLRVVVGTSLTYSLGTWVSCHTGLRKKVATGEGNPKVPKNKV